MSKEATDAQRPTFDPPSFQSQVASHRASTLWASLTTPLHDGLTEHIIPLLFQSPELLYFVGVLVDDNLISLVGKSLLSFFLIQLSCFLPSQGRACSPLETGRA